MNEALHAEQNNAVADIVEHGDQVGEDEEGDQAEGKLANNVANCLKPRRQPFSPAEEAQALGDYEPLAQHLLLILHPIRARHYARVGEPHQI